MKKKHRRSPTLEERMTPCLICSHPLSQRHHLFAFNQWGLNEHHTVQLCANCHDIYHSFERYIRNKHNEAPHLIEIPSREDNFVQMLLDLNPLYLCLMDLAKAFYLWSYPPKKYEPCAYSAETMKDMPEDQRKYGEALGVIASFDWHVKHKKYELERERNRNDRYATRAI